MAQIWSSDPFDRCAIAVSGGSDSTALMLLAHQWAQTCGVNLHVVTVDHALRPTSADEALNVAKMARELGLAQTTLTWGKWTGTGNLQDAARQARYDLINEWRGPIQHLLVGHTLDDQAETVLLRIKRGSGVDGLAAMRPIQRRSNGMIILRPMLGIHRSELRDYLSARGVSWVDDPSNDMDRFDRITIRKLAPTLAEIGITPERLSDMAAHMARAADVLREEAAIAYGQIGEKTFHGLSFDQNGFWALPMDTQTRLFAAAITWVAPNLYRPRYDALTRVLDQLRQGKTQTLQGAIIGVRRGKILIDREYNAIKSHELPAQAGKILDGIWQLNTDFGITHHFRPLGPDGAQQLSRDLRGDYLLRSVTSQPAVFQGEKLISTPLMGKDHQKKFTDMRPNFAEFLIAH